jgi:hypothetical protein
MKGLIFDSERVFQPDKREEEPCSENDIMLIINRGESGRESSVTVSSVTIDTIIRGTFRRNRTAPCAPHI